MESGERTMDLVRLPREEKLFDREAVLGRDVTSVFPTQNEGAERISAEKAKLSVGAARFVSETQLEELRARQGEAKEESAAPDKPLAQVLAEAKQAKEDKFQAVWQSMKRGKNRPLDDDELEFVNELLEQERSKDRHVASEELKEMDAFREAVKIASERKAQAIPVGPSAPVRKGDDRNAAPARKPQFVPIMRVKASEAVRGSNAAVRSAASVADTARRKQAAEPPAKRTKVAGDDELAAAVQKTTHADVEDKHHGGLDSLLGGYDSDSQ